MVATLDAFSGGGGGGGGSGMPDATVVQRGTAAAVATLTETTVVSRVVPPGFTFKLTQVIATGSAAAEWTVYDDAAEVYRTRSSPTDRAVELLHDHALTFAAGHTVALKATHQETSVQNFYGSLIGFDG